MNEWFSDLFSGFRTAPVATALTILVGVNFFQYRINQQQSRELLDMRSKNENRLDKLLDEKLEQKFSDEVVPRLDTIQYNVAQSTDKVDTALKIVQRTAISLKKQNKK